MMGKRGVRPRDPIATVLTNYIPEPNSGCHLWLGTAGYCAGHMRPILTLCGKRDYAYRHVWRIEFGPIPPGGHILHRCDNPMCVNISHLFLGDQVANMRDKTTKGRAGNRFQASKTHCRNGHEYTPENTRIVRSESGTERVCRLCNRAAVNRYYQRTRGKAQ